MLNSVADLEVRNEVLFGKIKTKILGEVDKDNYALSAIDAAQIMTAFCKLDFFDNELFYYLQECFFDEISQVKQAQEKGVQPTKTTLTPESLITMFCAH